MAYRSIIIILDRSHFIGTSSSFQPMDSFQRVLDPAEHVFEIYADSGSIGDRLGYLNDVDSIEVEVAGEVYDVRQSRSAFRNTRQYDGGTTGFVVWSTSPLMAEWLLDTSNYSGLRRVLGDLSRLQVLELGAGVGGVLARCLAPRTAKYVVTDQKQLLGLLSENTQGVRKLELAEFDWETTDESTVLDKFDGGYPDLILACDTIYNEYLVDVFIDALANCCDKDTRCIVGVHLRDNEVLERFVETALAKFQVYWVPREQRTPSLRNGYSIYYMILI